MQTNLAPYSIKELETTEQLLPSNIQEISRAVRSIERHNVTNQVDAVFELCGQMEREAMISGVKKCVTGSMAMYVLFEEMREQGYTLQLLEQRAARGKNDFDIGLSPENITRIHQVWKFDHWVWNENDNNSGGHGVIHGTAQMVDLLKRDELPHFPWKEVTKGDSTVFICSAEEMIFEKLHALARGIDNNPTAKWGIDIKLLKLYLMNSLRVGEQQLELYLTEKWDEYQEDRLIQGQQSTIEALKNVKSIRALFATMLQVDESEVLEKVCAQYNITPDVATPLLDARNGDEFVHELRKVYKMVGNYQTYEQINKNAEATYAEVMVRLEM